MKKKVFHCTYPLELSETIISVFAFFLDPGIFNWTPKQIERKLTVIVSMFECELGVTKGCIDFFYLIKNWILPEIGQSPFSFVKGGVSC